MGLLSSIFGKPTQTSKMRIAGLAASSVDFVLKDSGLGMLIAGSLVLNKALGISFRSGRPKIAGDIIASVALGELKEAEILRVIAKNGVEDVNLFRPLVDQ